MRALPSVIKVIERVVEVAAYAAGAAVLLACLISAGNAVVRYVFNTSSNAWLEIQWYLFAFGVLFGSPEVLRRNEHVRVDILYSKLGARGKYWIDTLGTLFLLLPVVLLMTWLSWPFFMRAWLGGEVSGNAGGLLRWPVWLMMPIGFALLLAEGIALLLKRSLPGKHELGQLPDYERPLQ